MYIVSEVSRKLFNKNIYEAIQRPPGMGNLTMRIDLVLHLETRSRIVEAQFVVRSVLNLSHRANKSRWRIRRAPADQVSLAGRYRRNLAIQSLARQRGVERKIHNSIVFDLTRRDPTWT
jgi:hypothetical protein